MVIISGGAEGEVVTMSGVVVVRGVGVIVEVEVETVVVVVELVVVVVVVVIGWGRDCS